MTTNNCGLLVIQNKRKRLDAPGPQERESEDGELERSCISITLQMFLCTLGTLEQVFRLCGTLPEKTADDSSVLVGEWTEMLHIILCVTLNLSTTQRT